MHPSWRECLECRGERSQLMDYSEPPRMPTLMEPTPPSAPRGATVIEVSAQTPVSTATPASIQSTGQLGTTRVVKPREPAPSGTSPAPTPAMRRETQFGGLPAQPAAARPAAPAGQPASAAPEPGKKTERRIVGVLLTYTWKPEGQIFPVREGRNRIGRNTDCEISLPEDPHLSGANSHITYRKNFTVGDLVSMGGTDLNGDPVEETHVRLPNYAQIRAGSTHFTFITVDPNMGT